ncbi:MAG: DUF177 domain-containing protein [Amphiplicatus sp.]
MSTIDPDKEFSKVADISGLPSEGRVFDLSPNEVQRAAIARRLDIPAVNALGGRIDIRPTQSGIVLTGRVEASLVRVCVITLEHTEEAIDEAFELRFVRNQGRDESDVELVIDENTPEPLESDEIDIGEVLVQQLALAMNPYPRREGVVVAEAEFGQAFETSPFAVLKGAIAERRDEE